MRDTIEELKGILRNGQHIEYHHEGEEEIISDSNMLKNIFINLISNAIKFSPENGVIQVKSLINGDYATIAVTDQGIGISEEDQNHLFSSFFRGKNAMNIQGTGLGLHIVKRYIDLLNGKINLQSKLGEGTTIHFSIPVK